MYEVVSKALASTVTRAVLVGELGPLDAPAPLPIKWESDGAGLVNNTEMRWEIPPRTRVVAIYLTDADGNVHEKHFLPGGGEYFAREGTLYIRKRRLRISVVIH